MFLSNNSELLPCLSSYIWFLWPLILWPGKKVQSGPVSLDIKIRPDTAVNYFSSIDLLLLRLTDKTRLQALLTSSKLCRWRQLYYMELKYQGPMPYGSLNSLSKIGYGIRVIKKFVYICYICIQVQSC